jgi:hypothetical protein
MPVFCLFTLGRLGNFTAGVTLEQPDLLCTALAVNIELLVGPFWFPLTSITQNYKNLVKSVGTLIKDNFIRVILI